MHPPVTLVGSDNLKPASVAINSLDFGQSCFDAVDLCVIKKVLQQNWEVSK